MKMHAHKKRISGEGLSAHSATGFVEALALSRGAMQLQSLPSSGSVQTQSLPPAPKPQQQFALPQARESVADGSFPWDVQQDAASAPAKRPSTHELVPMPPSKKPKLSALDKLLQNQRDHQLLMAKQQHAFQQQLMSMIANNAITE